MTTQMRPKLLLVAMLLATVVLAACGGDESEQPPETPTPATVPTATADESEPSHAAVTSSEARSLLPSTSAVGAFLY